MPFDESLTLENLGVALHAASRAHLERRVLLEGYFALKLDSESLRQWIRFAQHVLAERNAQVLMQQLPPLLKTRDKRVLKGLVPA